MALWLSACEGACDRALEKGATIEAHSCSVWACWTREQQEKKFQRNIFSAFTLLLYLCLQSLIQFSITYISSFLYNFLKSRRIWGIAPWLHMFKLYRQSGSLLVPANSSLLGTNDKPFIVFLWLGFGDDFIGLASDLQRVVNFCQSFTKHYVSQVLTPFCEKLRWWLVMMMNVV